MYVCVWGGYTGLVRSPWGVDVKLNKGLHKLGQVSKAALKV